MTAINQFCLNGNLHLGNNLFDKNGNVYSNLNANSFD